MDKELTAKILRDPTVASLIVAAATGIAPPELVPVDIPQRCQPEPQIGCDVVLYADSAGRMYGLGRFPSDLCWFGSCYIVGDTMSQVGGDHIQGKRPAIAITDNGVETATVETIQQKIGLMLRTTVTDIPTSGQAALAELVSVLKGQAIVPHTELGKIAIKIKEEK